MVGVRGHGHVHFAVVIEIAGAHKFRYLVQTVGIDQLETAVALAEKNRHVAKLIDRRVHHREIQIAVAVEIGGGQRNGGTAVGRLGGSAVRKSAVTIVEQHPYDAVGFAQLVAAGIGDGDVGLSVVVEIAERQCVRAVAGAIFVLLKTKGLCRRQAG